MAEINELLEAAVKAEDGTARNIIFRRIITNFLQSSAYYIEFDSKYWAPEDSFYYALVSTSGTVQLYNDGESVISALQSILDRRRNLWQRLNEFSLIEIIAAVIAVSVTIAFVYLSLANRELNREFTGIFGIIVGYYFGKGTSSGGA
jgi:hypothetical protein